MGINISMLEYVITTLRLYYKIQSYVTGMCSVLYSLYKLYVVNSAVVRHRLIYSCEVLKKPQTKYNKLNNVIYTRNKQMLFNANIASGKLTLFGFSDNPSCLHFL